MRKHPIYFILSLIAPTVFFSSCGEDRSGEYYALIAEKTWIYETMQQNYLFYEDLPSEEEVDFFKKPEEFLSSVISERDQKNGTVFSHIDSIKTSRVQSEYPTFGIEGALVRGNSGDYYCTVLYTYSNSPASEMGLKRGDHIFMVDSQKINTSNYIEYFQRPVKSYRYQVARKDAAGKPDTLEITTPAPQIVEQPSVYLTRTFTTTNGKKVFYIMYNSFETADEADLKAKFAEGLAGSPTDIVLDLRYNPGGYVSTAQLLGTMLAPSSAMGKDCFSLVYNDKINKADTYTFDPTLLQGSPNASVDHLYILTSENTASAAELVINSLRPYLGDKLLQVGQNTFGKNVAQALFTNEAYPQLEFWLTTAYISNSEGFYDYYTNGLEADYKQEEDLTGNLGELGTAQDSLMVPVLYHLEHGSFPVTEPEQPDETPASRWLGNTHKSQVIYNPVAHKPKYSKITIK